MGIRFPAFAFLTALLCTAPPGAQAAAEYSQTRLIVKFRGHPDLTEAPPGVARAAAPALDALLRRFDARSVRPLFPRTARNPELQDRLGTDRFHVVDMRRPADVPAAVAAFRSLPEVELAEPDYVMTGAGRATAELVPNDPSFPTQWAFRNTGTSATCATGTAGADIKATDAWEVTTGDSSVVVAVLDSGLRMDHPEFAGRVWTNTGEIPGNSTDDDGNGYVDDVHGFDFVNGDGDPSDDLFHGTAVASVLAANGNNGSLVAGLDWSCKIVPVKVINSSNFGFYSWWAAGIYYAVSVGARVINMSLVGYGPSSALEAATQFAHESGVFIAAAAGNDDTSSPSVPAMFPGVVAVGSTDTRDERCTPARCGYGSNFGPYIDVVAPGTCIAILYYSAPDLVVYGGGTSFATPMVAGLASLLLARNSARTPDQLQDIIRSSADDQVGPPGEDAPGFDDYYGYGRINCRRALAPQSHAAPPVVTAPAAVSIAEGVPVSFDVSASDPDGDAILFLKADLSGLPAGNSAVFTVNADRTMGHLDWTPGYTQAGGYAVTFTASSPLLGSAVTEIQVANVNDPPVLTAPLQIEALEGQETVADVSVSDADGDPITYLAATPLPTGATFTTSADRRAGQFRWTPGFDQQGTRTLQFVARSTSVTPSVTLEAEVDALLHVMDLDRSPIVTAPGRVDGAEGVAVSVPVAAADPDGDPLTALVADQLPAGATFTASPDFGSGLLEWTPGFTQSGDHLVVVTATSLHTVPGSTPQSQGGSAYVLLSIADAPDHPPAITAPAEVAVAEGSPLSVAVSYSDVDGDAIGEVGASPLPAGASFTPNGEHTSATLAWTPNYGQAGAYSITLSVESAHRPSPLSAPVPADAFATLTITVTNTDRAPVVGAPAEISVPEAQPLTVSVAAADPDGDAVGSLAMTGAPLGATFAEDPTHTSGTLSWTPTYNDAGTYAVTFVASNALAGSAVCSIVVENVNRAPVSNPGGPYQGVAGVPIDFDGSGSFDPDGAALTRPAWDFGDLATATGLAPSHAYAAGGTYAVTLTVSDGELSGATSTTASVRSVFAARAFPVPQDRVIRLLAAKPTVCFRIEPLDGSYESSALDPALLQMLSPGTGSVDAIQALAGKASMAGDTDRNGVEEVGACFSKDDLRRLFQNLTEGRHRMPVRLEAPLQTGGIVRASLDLDVLATEGSLAATFSPSPMRERGVLSVRVERGGPLSVRLFDTSGRLVRSLAGLTVSAPGYQDIPIDDRGPDGRELRSGVYFYRVETSAGVATGRLVLVR